MTNEQKASAWDKASELAAAATKTGDASYNVVLNKLILMSKWQAKYDNLMLNAKGKDIIQTDMNWKAVYDAEVVRHAELKAELDALKAEHSKAKQQLAEYRQTLAELSNTNSKLVKDIAALSIYRCMENGNIRNIRN